MGTVTDQTPPRRAGWLERVPLHPLLAAAFPVLFLWSHNVDEVFADDVWPVLGAVVLAGVVVWGLTGLAYRDLRRGALVSSAVMLVLLSYGHMASPLSADLGLVLAGSILATVAVLVHAARPPTIGVVTILANVVALVLVVTALPALASRGFASMGGAREARAEVADDLGDGFAGPVRDIYYVVLDRYPREDSLREVFGYDNSDFTSFLEQRGFDVAQQSLANYPKTAHSLAASLNMTYLDHLEERVPEGQLADWRPVYRMLDDHVVGELLTDAGYEYLHLGTWWEPTSAAVRADRVLTYGSGSEFSRVFRQTTIWPALEAGLGLGSPLGDRELIAAFSEHQFDVLDRLAGDRGNAPRFVFAHITVPHEPYVFEADGSFVPAEVEQERDRVERFVPHLQYANRRIGLFVEKLLHDREEEDEPIIVIQSDEGPHPVSRPGVDADLSWLDAPVEDLQEKLRILNAYHLPGVNDEDVPEDITPVNTFRLILSRYFGADLPALRDRTYVFPDESRLYRFTDVTDRVRG